MYYLLRNISKYQYNYIFTFLAFDNVTSCDGYCSITLLPLCFNWLMSKVRIKI